MNTSTPDGEKTLVGVTTQPVWVLPCTLGCRALQSWFEASSRQGNRILNCETAGITDDLSQPGLFPGSPNGAFQQCEAYTSAANGTRHLEPLAGH